MCFESSQTKSLILQKFRNWFESIWTFILKDIKFYFLKRKYWFARFGLYAFVIVDYPVTSLLGRLQFIFFLKFLLFPTGFTIGARPLCLSSLSTWFDTCFFRLENMNAIARWNIHVIGTLAYLEIFRIEIGITILVVEIYWY